MSLRVFRCDQCDHRMRLFGTQCGKCGEPKPVFQRPILYVVGAVAAPLLFFALK